VVDVTATGKGAGPQSEVCRELKTAGLLAIGPLGLMAGGPEDHFTDSRELYVLVEGAACMEYEPTRDRRPPGDPGGCRRVVRLVRRRRR
jgi:hypothetical protein